MRSRAIALELGAGAPRTGSDESLPLGAQTNVLLSITRMRGARAESGARPLVPQLKDVGSQCEGIGRESTAFAARCC